MPRRWLPNAITVARIVLVPVWGVLAELSRRGFDVATPEPYRSWSAAVLLAIGVSDLADGWLARRFGLATRTGATLDAIADKLAQVCLLTFFTLRGAPAYTAIPLWFLVLVFARDVLLLAGYVALKRRRGTVRVVHRAHGKASSVVLFGLLVWINLGGGPDPVTWVVPGVAVLVALSTFAYLREGWRQARTPPSAVAR
ncbi:MAG TPA: CDP-alcohol phosphatidyltransferase family protein [Planctomycetota bacterium]|nr:CDP-alcohol phosphatidyltransferase family protein [Planctomycetota bacterium]